MAYCRTPRRVQHIHDIRMVWPAQTPADEGHNLGYATHNSNIAVMGHSSVGILLHGAGQPLLIPRKRRSILAAATQSDTRGNLTDDIYSIHNTVFSRRGPSLEPFPGLLPPHNRGLPRIYGQLTPRI